MTETVSSYGVIENESQPQAPPRENGRYTVKDNRVRLEVDARKVELWEIMVLEQAVISDWLMVLARYLVNDDGPLSPDLPHTPIDELTPEEVEMFKQSKAYKALKRFSLPSLKDAAKAFTDGIEAGF